MSNLDIIRMLEISLEYGVKPTPEQLVAISALLGREAKVDEKGILDWSDRKLECTFSEALGLDVKFTVEKAMKYVRPHELTEQFKQMDIRQSAPAPINETCNVHIGGNHLMQITTVKVCTDYCTDLLQGELSKGWRILAVCVQPDGRRPDYVLGMI